MTDNSTLAGSEQPVLRPASRGPAALRLLAGPIIYSIYFLAAYLLVEAACSMGLLNFSLGGTNGVTATVIGLTALTLVVLLASLALQVMRLRRLPVRLDPETGDPDRFVAQVGIMLDLLFLLLVAATGAPALLLSPCGWG